MLRLMLLALTAAPAVADVCAMPALHHAVVLFNGDDTQTAYRTGAHTLGNEGDECVRGVAVRGDAAFPQYSVAISGPPSIVVGSVTGSVEFKSGVRSDEDDFASEYNAEDWRTYAAALKAAVDNGDEQLSTRVRFYEPNSGNVNLIDDDPDYVQPESQSLHIVIGSGTVRADNDQNSKIDGAIIAPDADVVIHRRWHHAHGFIVARTLIEVVPGDSGLQIHGQVPTGIMCAHDHGGTPSTTSESSAGGKVTTSTETSAKTATTTPATQESSTSRSVTTSTETTRETTRASATTVASKEATSTSSVAIDVDYCLAAHGQGEDYEYGEGEGEGEGGYYYEGEGGEYYRGEGSNSGHEEDGGHTHTQDVPANEAVTCCAQFGLLCGTARAECSTAVQHGSRSTSSECCTEFNECSLRCDSSLLGDMSDSERRICCEERGVCDDGYFAWSAAPGSGPHMPGAAQQALMVTGEGGEEALVRNPMHALRRVRRGLLSAAGGALAPGDVEISRIGLLDSTGSPVDSGLVVDVPWAANAKLELEDGERNLLDVLAALNARAQMHRRAVSTLGQETQGDLGLWFEVLVTKPSEEELHDAMAALSAEAPVGTPYYTPMHVKTVVTPPPPPPLRVSTTWGTMLVGGGVIFGLLVVGAGVATMQRKLARTVNGVDLESPLYTEEPMSDKQSQMADCSGTTAADRPLPPA